MQIQLSRNAICPCNSGEKYKKCCIGKLNIEQESYYGLLHRQNILRNKIFQWINENISHEELDHYIYEYNKRDSSEIDEHDKIFFLEWMLHEAKIGERKLFTLLLEDYSSIFDETESEILSAWRDTTQSGIFEVEEIQKNEWKTKCKEIISKKEYIIKDRKMTETVVKGDIFFGRSQQIFSSWYLSGVVQSFSRDILDDLQNFIIEKYEQEKKHNSALSYEQFMNDNGKIVNDFVPPELAFITEEGEPCKECEATYSTNQEIIPEMLKWFEKDEKLFSIGEVKQKGKKIIAYIDILSTEPEKAYDQKNELENKRMLIMTSHLVDEKGNKIRANGGISIKDNKITIFSMNEKSFNKINQKLKKKFGPHITLEKESQKFAEEVLEEMKENTEEIVKEKSPKKMHKIEKQLLEEYYGTWSDQKIPYLDYNTPRNAIKTEQGREKVKKLLRDFEYEEEHKKRQGEKYINAAKIIRRDLNFYE